MKKDHTANKEYRYSCSIDCGGTPLRVYERTLNSTNPWTSLEDYVASPTFVWYNESSDYNWLPGHWLSELDPPGEGSMYYQDAFGVHVAGEFSPQAPAQPLPEYMQGDEGLVFADCELVHPVFAFGLSSQQKGKTTPTKPQKKETPFSKCLKTCDKLHDKLKSECYSQFDTCMGSKDKNESECNTQLANCLSQAGMIATGCAMRCYDQGYMNTPKKPSPEKINIGPIRFDPQADYEECYPNWKDKIPGLPKPPAK